MLLTIEKLIYGGDGLARLPADERGRGKAVFVPFVLPGEEIQADIVEEKPGFARARLESVRKASPQRISPQCRYFQGCGGCHYQHIPYEQQLEIKAGILKENLRRIAKVELDRDLVIHPSPPWNYRNRARLRIRSGEDFALGYYRFGSHELQPVEECPISSHLINRAIAELWEAGRSGKVHPAVQEVELFAGSGDQQILVAVYCAAEAAASEAGAAAQQLQRELSNATGAVAFRHLPGAHTSAEPERLASSENESLTYATAHASYRVSAGGFFQVNRHLIDELTGVVTANASGRLALDLFAGGGLFSVVLARSFPQVIAVEASQTAHADLLYNAPGNVKVVRAMADQYLKNAGRTSRPDFVVVDPPRSGLGESVVRSLAASGAAKVMYVSCDPATLARDLGGLLRAGYRIEQAHLVDLFPQTFHLESVVQLIR